MNYNFLNLFNSSTTEILDELIDEYTSCISTYDQKASITLSYYTKIIDTLNSNFKINTLLHDFEELAKYKISLDTPYIIITNEINALKTILISKLDEDKIGENILFILSLFKELNNKIAYVYLFEYTSKLISHNNIRIASLSDLLEKNIISHYESHLIWLTKLAKHIKSKEKNNFPELNSSNCDFGKWLHVDGKNIIQNNSKYKIINKYHDTLHIFANKIYLNINSSEYHVLITYLEKCEFISLSIGTELALIDNIIMNKRVTKDTLTQALNRNGLRSIFESQYELSLATNNHFVLAICDLDHFKNINDTYGHVAGDKILQNFVTIAKKQIRNSDVIIRYGGEEFVIILPAVSKDKGYDVLKSICTNFENNSLEFNGSIINATVSIGMMGIIPEQPFKHSFIDEYIMIADQRLYRAKQSGRNKVESS